MNRNRRTLRRIQRTLRNLRQRDFDGFLKLRIASGDYVSRRDLGVEIRRDANVLNPPTRPTRIVCSAIRQTNLPAVNKLRCKVIWTNATAESALADQWSNLRQLEHKRTGLRGRAVQFIYDQHLHRRRGINRRGDVVAAAKHVVVKRLALHPFDQIVGRDAAAVETLIDDDAVLVGGAGQAANSIDD